jgi:hypothetical protein
MADAFDPTDPRHLTPEQRFDELTLIFATGARRALALRRTQTPPESAPDGLDVSAETSVHAPVELTQAESTEGVEA